MSSMSSLRLAVMELIVGGSGAADHVKSVSSSWDSSITALCAIRGAKSGSRDLTPVWTMPGNEAKTGHLTSEFHRFVQAARQSVVCATYNFEQTSQMWTVLKAASEQPDVVVTVYIDGDKSDAAKVKAQLPRATIYQSAQLPSGKRVVSHGKVHCCRPRGAAAYQRQLLFQRRESECRIRPPGPRFRACRVRRVYDDE